MGAVWAMLAEVLHAEGEVDGALLRDFTAALQAAPAGLLSLWPFLGSTTTMTNSACNSYSIPDLIWTAFHMQRLQHMLPFLEQLFLTATAIDPDTCPTLHETLSLLAEASTRPRMQPYQQPIAKLLFFWGLRELPLIGATRHWSDEASGLRVTASVPAQYRHCLSPGEFGPGSGKLEQPRPNRCSNAFAALQQLPSSAPRSPIQEAANAMKRDASSDIKVCRIPNCVCCGLVNCCLCRVCHCCMSAAQSNTASTCTKYDMTHDAVGCMSMHHACAAATYDYATCAYLQCFMLMAPPTKILTNYLLHCIDCTHSLLSVSCAMCRQVSNSSHPWKRLWQQSKPENMAGLKQSLTVSRLLH